MKHFLVYLGLILFCIFAPYFLGAGTVGHGSFVFLWIVGVVDMAAMFGCIVLVQKISEWLNLGNDEDP